MPEEITRKGIDRIVNKVRNRFMDGKYAEPTAENTLFVGMVGYKALRCAVWERRSDNFVKSLKEILSDREYDIFLAWCYGRQEELNERA